MTAPGRTGQHPQAPALSRQVSGTYVYVRDRQMTLAGLRGSRPAQLIGKLGANNQLMAEVQTLKTHGKLDSD